MGFSWSFCFKVCNLLAILLAVFYDQPRSSTTLKGHVFCFLYKNLPREAFLIPRGLRRSWAWSPSGAWRWRSPSWRRCACRRSGSAGSELRVGGLVALVWWKRWLWGELFWDFFSVANETSRFFVVVCGFCGKVAHDMFPMKLGWKVRPC